MRWLKRLSFTLLILVIIVLVSYLFYQKSPEHIVKQAKEKHLSQMLDYYSSNQACLESLTNTVLLLPDHSAYWGVKAEVVPNNDESIPAAVQESIKELRLSEGMGNFHPYLSLSTDFVGVELVDETNIMAWVFYSTKFKLEDKKCDYNYIQELNENWFVAITYIERG